MGRTELQSNCKYNSCWEGECRMGGAGHELGEFASGKDGGGRGGGRGGEALTPSLGARLERERAEPHGMVTEDINSTSVY